MNIERVEPTQPPSFEEEFKLNVKSGTPATSTEYSLQQENEYEDEQIKEKCIIHPRGRRKLLWDTFILLLLMISSIVIPLVIAFNFDESLYSTSGQLLFVIDICLCIDIALTFRTGFYDRYDHSKLISNSRLIARNYLRGWFAFDVIASAPFNVIIPNDYNDSEGRYSYASYGKTLRLIRFVVQILKILRARKMARLFKEHTVFEFKSFGKNAKFWLHLINILLVMLLYAHYMSCIWFLTGVNIANKGRYSWLIKYDLYDDDASFFEQYTNSFYWSTVTLFTVGYGDISATNSEEEWVTIILIVGGSCFSAYFLATITVLLFGGDKVSQLQNESFSKVHEFCDHYNFNRGKLGNLRREMIAHAKYYHAYNRRSFSMNILPFHLQLKIKKKLSNTSILLKHLDMFKDLDPHIVGQLILDIKSVACDGGDFLFKYKEFADRMFIQRTGSSQLLFKHHIDDNRILNRGDVCGEYCLINRHRLHSLQSLTWSEYYVLTKKDIKCAIFEFYSDEIAAKNWKNILQIVGDERITRKVQFKRHQSMENDLDDSVGDSDMEMQDLDINDAINDQSSPNYEKQLWDRLSPKIKAKFANMHRTASEQRDKGIAKHYKKRLEFKTM